MTGRLGALSAALTGEVQRRAQRAMLLSVGLGLLAVVALGASILPLSFTANLLLGYGLFLVVTGISLAWLLLRAFGGDFGDALAVAGWARLDAEERRRRIGAGRIPRNHDEARAWLAAHPDPGTFHPQRLSAQIMLGDLPAARATLATYPAGTDIERFEILDDGWFVGFLEAEAGGQVPDIGPLQAAAAAMTDPEEHALAAAEVATARAHAAVAAGDDWIEPLAACRPVLDERADGIVGSRYVVATWTIVILAATLLVGAALLVGRFTGVWTSG